MDYRKLINTKTYDGMTEKELAFCIATEIDYYRDKVNKLREEGVPDYKIVAFLYDLWRDNLIADDAKMTFAYNISNDNWEKGINYYWYVMEESNPLKD